MLLLSFFISFTFLFGQYNFDLEDLNINSEYYGQLVGPSDFQNQVILVYFGHFN